MRVLSTWLPSRKLVLIIVIAATSQACEVNNSAPSEPHSEKGDVMQFFALVHNGNVTLTEGLLEKSPELLHATDINGRSPLHIAAWSNQPRMVGYLLRLGADPNSKDDAEVTPLGLAGSVEIGKILIEAGASLDANTLGPSPLLIQAEAGNLEMVKLLIEKGARVDQMAFGKVTALMAAVKSGNSDVVQVLLDHGANPDAAMLDGQTPLTLARKQSENYVKMEGMLKNHSPKN